MISSVPISFYFLFWPKNSLMGLGLGIILGALSRLPFGLIAPALEGSIVIGPFFVGFLTLFWAQISSVQHFLGRRRGHFEYAYRERLVVKEGNALIRKEIGLIRFAGLFWEELSDFSATREDIYKELLARLEGTGNPGLKFPIYLKMSRSAIKHFNFEKGIEWLEIALALRPNDLVANFRLATSLEKAGDGKGAVNRYKVILKDCHIETFELKKFIEDQIERVEKEGPAKRPPMVGLRYMQF